MNKLLPYALLFIISSSFIFISCQKEMRSTNKDGYNDEQITDTTIFIDITVDGERTLGIQQLQATQKYGPWFLEWGGTRLNNVYLGYFQGASLQKDDLLQRFDFMKGNIALFASGIGADTVAHNSLKKYTAFFAPGTYNYSGYGSDTIVSSGGGMDTTFKQLTNGIVLQWIDKMVQLGELAALVLTKPEASLLLRIVNPQAIQPEILFSRIE